MMNSIPAATSSSLDPTVTSAGVVHVTDVGRFCLPHRPAGLRVERRDEGRWPLSSSHCRMTSPMQRSATRRAEPHRLEVADVIFQSSFPAKSYAKTPSGPK